MDITNYRIYDLEESIVASGLPMLDEFSSGQFTDEETDVQLASIPPLTLKNNPHFNRACKLAANPPGTGHNNFLSGILVSMNVTATVKWWEQFQRYHFKQIVSSMSTMHRLRKMMQEKTIRFDEKTDKAVIEAFMNLLNDETVSDETLAYSCPMGLMLTARVSTNYLQLKTIYGQRCDHKLEEWRIFCEWIRTLPMAEYFI